MLIDGRVLAQTILEDLRKRVFRLQENTGIIPHLAIIRVGNDPATTAYVNQKEKMGRQIGGLVSTYNYPDTVSEKELLASIDFLQSKGNIHGLIVQLPLPKQVNESTVTNAVNISMDVDGFRLESEFITPIAKAVLRILVEIHKFDQGKRNYEEHMKDFSNWISLQKIVIMGKGKTGGEPIITTLSKMGIQPIVIDSKTQNSDAITREADILICAVGNKGTIINESNIKKDAILIGIGMHKGEDGKLHGDYASEDIKEKAGFYTPIPGGIGTVNAAMLLVNVVDAAEKQLL